MANELKDILKKSNKTKLIQLAVDSTINLQDSILSEEEKDTIRQRAYKEGWDNELERATQKARDILMIGMEAEKLLYQAMFFLHDIKDRIEPTEKLLSQLENAYIRDYNEDTEKYDTIVDKTKEEMDKDILSELNRVDVYKLNDKEDKVDGLLDNYLRLFAEAKQAVYLLTNSKVGGYRLYKKADVDTVKIVLMLNRANAVGIIDIADHIDFCIDNLSKYKPEILEGIKRLNDREKFLLIDKERVRGLSKRLNAVADLSISKEEMEEQRDRVSGFRDTKDGEGYTFTLLTDKLISENYLLTGIGKDMREKLENSIVKLTEYVKYGR